MDVVCCSRDWCFKGSGFYIKSRAITLHEVILNTCLSITTLWRYTFNSANKFQILFTCTLVLATLWVLNQFKGNKSCPTIASKRTFGRGYNNKPRFHHIQYKKFANSFCSKVRQPFQPHKHKHSYSQIWDSSGCSECVKNKMNSRQQNTNRRMDDLLFYVLFNIILVISGQWEADNERLCATELRLQLRRFHLERGSNLGSQDQ